MQGCEENHFYMLQHRKTDQVSLPQNHFSAPGHSKPIHLKSKMEKNRFFLLKQFFGHGQTKIFEFFFFFSILEQGLFLIFKKF